MKWLHFILSHSFFISICAFFLCWQSYILLHIPVQFDVCLLIFFATLGSYNFYWLLSKYHFNDKRGLADFFTKNISNVLVLMSAAAGVFFLRHLLPAMLQEIIVAVILTLAYSIPLWPVKSLAFTRKAGLLKTVLLAFTWTYVTIVIPVEQASLPWNWQVSLLFTARFMFMLMLCIIFDSRDVKVDKIRSLSSLATVVSRKTLGILIMAVLSVYLAAGFALRFYFESGAQVFSFLITGLAVLVVYRLSLKKQGYFFYYFLVDGLMLFSAITTILASI